MLNDVFCKTIIKLVLDAFVQWKFSVEMRPFLRVHMIVEKRRKAAEQEYREKLESIDRASDERSYSNDLKLILY